MCTLVGELSDWYDYFLRLSGFSDLFGKVFLVTFKDTHREKRCHNVVATLRFRRRYYNQKLTLLQRCVFDVWYKRCSNVMILMSLS